eukprot:TRINITY_DN111613_c0_g1_i1.p1 TRINITY_DN111613_c0_g1~~TRINITY_DN111613_c0_g1_i1.p1  ORF type:complete len:442 (-),score=70.88 TRINITY_DN111613_c0_g1_i1:81-1373(-)
MAEPEIFSCACGYTSWSKLLFEDHSCSFKRSADDSVGAKHDTFESWSYSRYDVTGSDAGKALSIPNRDVSNDHLESDLITGPARSVSVLPSSQAWALDAGLEYNDSYAGSYTCICGFSSFSQLLFEDHVCSLTTREAVKSAIFATTAQRLQDAGLSRLSVSARTEKGPQGIIIVSQETGRVIWGPNDILSGDKSISWLITKALNEIGQPFASMQLFHQDTYLAPETILSQELPRQATLTAIVSSTPLLLEAKSQFFNQFPDIITEISLSVTKESSFEELVKQTCADLSELCGKYRLTCTCLSGAIQKTDAKSLLALVEEKPCGLSCVGYKECLDRDQWQRLESFLQKVGSIRYWKHDSFGQHWILGWAAGHQLRMSIVSEDGPPARTFSTMWKKEQESRATSHKASSFKHDLDAELTAKFAAQAAKIWND